MEDNHTTSNFADATAQIAVMLQTGDVEGAVRLSGELLANCDNELQRLKNAGESIDEAVGQFIEAAVLHVHSLRLAGQANDAFSCAVGALLTVEIYGAGDRVDSARKLRLYSFALASAIDCFDALPDNGDPASEDHRGFILSYLASLLYYYYSVTARETPDDPSLPEAYRFLKAIEQSGAIQTPKIRLGEKEVDPASPGPLLVDIMGRAAALGIYA